MTLLHRAKKDQNDCGVNWGGTSKGLEPNLAVEMLNTATDDNFAVTTGPDLKGEALREDLTVIFSSFMKTLRQFKCVPTFGGSLSIHIFMLLFRLIADSSVLTSDFTWECKTAIEIGRPFDKMQNGAPVTSSPACSKSISVGWPVSPVQVPVSCRLCFKVNAKQ